MRNYRLARPPHSLRRPTVHLDNIALVPASLLPLSPAWQAIANGLPQGEMLIVLPTQEKQQYIILAVAAHLMQMGQQVRMIDQNLRPGTI